MNSRKFKNAGFFARQARARQGWVKKRPTSHKDRPFKQSAVVKRFFDTHGYQVAYYDRAPIGKHAGVRPFGLPPHSRRVRVFCVLAVSPPATPAKLQVSVGTMSGQWRKAAPGTWTTPPPSPVCCLNTEH